MSPIPPNLQGGGVGVGGKYINMFSTSTLIAIYKHENCIGYGSTLLVRNKYNTSYSIQITILIKACTVKA